jgi:hypothetical protein
VRRRNWILDTLLILQIMSAHVHALLYAASGCAPCYPYIRDGVSAYHSKALGPVFRAD